MKKFRLGLQKFAKGMFGIFMVKLVVFSTIMIYQSCDDSESVENDFAKENFINSMKLSRQNLSSIKFVTEKGLQDTSNSLIRTSNGELTEVVLVKENPDDQIDDVVTFDKLTELINAGIFILNEEEENCIETNGHTLCEVTYVNESEIMEAMEPIRN